MQKQKHRGGAGGDLVYWIIQRMGTHLSICASATTQAIVLVFKERREGAPVVTWPARSRPRNPPGVEPNHVWYRDFGRIWEPGFSDGALHCNDLGTA